MMMPSDMTASVVVKFYNNGIIKTTDGHVIDPELSSHLKTSHCRDHCLRRHPLIMVVQTTHFRQLADIAQLRRLNRSGHWSIHSEGTVHAPGVIIVHIRPEHTPQMRLVQHDDLSETLEPETPNDPFHVGILPWRARGDLHLFEAHVLDTLLKSCPVDAVAVAEQIPRRLIPRKSLDDLLSSPLGGWVLGDVDMHDAPTLVRQHDEHEEYPEGCRRHREEIAGDQVFNMIVQKGIVKLLTL